MNTQLPLDVLRMIDAACDSFEDDWRNGKQPRVEDYLQRSVASARPQLLQSLQKLQQELILEKFERDAPTPTPAPVSKATPAAPTPRPTASPDDLADRTLVVDAARVVLQVIAGPHQGLEFVYDEHDTLLAGRSSEAQLRLKDDLHFSRNHFRLEINPPTCFLMDLRSRNGTFVNSGRVTEQFLKDGDTVSGGRTKIKVCIQGGISPLDNAPAEASKATQPIIPQVSNAAVDRPSAVAQRPSQAAKVAAASPEPQAIQIAGYQLHEQIGNGDLGKVFRATRLVSSEQCALKVITPAARVDEKAMQTFLREASILNQLQHANIVRFIEMGSCGAELYLSTEFLTTLQWNSLVARWTPAQRIRVACGLMSQVLGALEYAHTRSLVHRDVKPGNILIFRTNGKLTAKLADFGLAKQYSTAGMSQVTREGDVIGSLPYMSPEQFINSREARPSCDIYSAGATLYWMLTGQEPILLENHPCKFLAILEDPPVPLQQRCPEAPVGLAQLVHRALEKSAEKRFASAAEMRQQLRTFAK